MNPSAPRLLSRRRFLTTVSAAGLATGWGSTTPAAGDTIDAHSHI